MFAVTIRIAPRKAGEDAVVEWYRWKKNAPGSKPSGTASLPAATIDALAPSKILKHFADTRGDSDQFGSDGRALFDALFAGKLSELWEDAKERSAAEEVRLYLAIDDPDLGRLPWELMADDDGPLFIRRNPIVLRWRTPAPTAPAVADPWPIRVLVVVGCSEKQATEIGVNQELAAIRGCLRAVDHSFDLEVLDARYSTVNRGEFRKRLDEFNPHILHFIGHATSDKKGAALKLYDRDKAGGESESWDANELRIVLQQKTRDLRVAYLNACRTQDATESVAASSLALAFLRVGVPAVVAMQANVHGDAASLSAAEFYRHLTLSDTIEVAVEAGRSRMLDRAELGLKTRNPYCAVLTVQRAPETVLQFRYRITDTTQRDAIEECATLKPVRRLFVNQASLRRDLITSFFSPPGGKERSAAVFRGVEYAGKSWLAKWMLAVYAFSGRGVRYIEARHYKNWLALMRAVVSESASGEYVRQPLPQRAQDYFFWTLNHIANGDSVPPGDPPANVVDSRLELSDAIARDNEAVSKIMQAFLEALKIAAGKDGFLLVADHWHASSDHSTAPITLADLKAHLWDRIAEDHASPVKLLLVLPPSMSGDAAITAAYPTAHWKHVTLPRVPAQEAPGLLSELYALHFQEEPSQKEREAFQVRADALLRELDGWAQSVRTMLRGQT